MKLTKRLIALALSGVLMLGGLTACGKVEVNLPEYDPATLDTATITDLTEFLIGVPGETVAATLNGEDITADELVYWIVAHCDSLQQSAYQTTGTLTIPWDADMGDGLSLEDYVRKQSISLAINQRMVAQMGEKEGLQITQEQQDQVQQILDSIAAEGMTQIGATLDQYLGLSMALDEALFRLNWRCDFMHDALTEARFTGENAPAEEDILAWLAEEQGLYRVKHILISTQDVEEEKLKEKRALADDLLAQLLAAEDPIALFDQLMLEYGEDPGVASNPDGYLAQPGQMVAEFEQTALNLQEGTFSDVVTSQFGYHIILRLPLNVDVEQYKTDYINSAMAQLVVGWVEQSKLETAEFCGEVDVQAVHERMTAYRNRFGQPPVEVTEPAEGDSSVAE